MTIIIFLLILSLLVFVHEAGHFLAAKAFKVRVDEFGFGYPPRAKKLFSWRGTLFTLNWLPFGGFVKIYGENPSEDNVRDPDSFSEKNSGAQAIILSAGVFGNFLLAWVLISIGLMMGMPSPEGLGLPVENVHVSITQILPDSPADRAGLKAGDTLVSLKRGGEESALTPEAVSAFIGRSVASVNVTVLRKEELITKTIVPNTDIFPDKPAIGFGLESVGTVTLPFFEAFYHGLRFTWGITVVTAQALINFFGDAFVGRANLNEVTGPVGLVGIVGDASRLGFVYLLSFTALISINLSIINLFPFPALDGGRLLFVALEAVSRRRIPPRVFNAINGAGFALLIFLMLLITFKDVRLIL